MGRQNARTTAVPRVSPASQTGHHGETATDAVPIIRSNEHKPAILGTATCMHNDARGSSSAFAQLRVAHACLGAMQRRIQRATTNCRRA